MEKSSGTRKRAWYGESSGVRRNATVNLGLDHISLERKRGIAVTYRYIFLLPKAISFFVMGTASMVAGQRGPDSPIAGGRKGSQVR